LASVLCASVGMYNYLYNVQLNIFGFYAAIYSGIVFLFFTVLLLNVRLSFDVGYNREPFKA